MEVFLNQHELYKRLGKDNATCEEVYRALFKSRIAESTLEEISNATNKAWVLGNDRFRNKIEKIQARQAS